MRTRFCTATMLAAASIASASFGQTLVTKIQGAPGTDYGFNFDVIGDVDNDGWLDVAAMRALPSLTIQLRSGKTGTLLHEYVPGPHPLNGSLRHAGDVDGDGAGDYLAATVGFGCCDNGHALIVSGATGHTLLDVMGPQGPGSYGELGSSAGYVGTRRGLLSG